MSTLAVAEKDFRDAVQSKALWALVIGFVGLSSLLSYAYVELIAASVGPQPGQSGDPTIDGLLFFIASAVGLFIPITAIVICYKAVAGERELGSIKLLLALPHTRGDVLFGKLLGRAGVLTTSLAIGLVFAFAIGFGLLGSVEVVPVLLFLLITLLFTATYVSVVVSISATTGSTSRATMLTLGFFLVFELGWGAVTTLLEIVAVELSLSDPNPNWAFLLSQVSPSTAYTSALVAVLPGTEDLMEQLVGPGNEAIYATPWVGLVVLGLWLVVPLAIGYVLFSSADL